MNLKGAVKFFRQIEGHAPLPVGKRFRLPPKGAEARWTAFYCDPFSFDEPVFGSGLLQMANVRITLFITKQPTESERRLQHRVDHGRPSVLSLIHISEPTRQAEISYAVFC